MRWLACAWIALCRALGRGKRKGEAENFTFLINVAAHAGTCRSDERPCDAKSSSPPTAGRRHSFRSELFAQAKGNGVAAEVGAR